MGLGGSKIFLKLFELAQMMSFLSLNPISAGVLSHSMGWGGILHPLLLLRFQGSSERFLKKSFRIA